MCDYSLERTHNRPARESDILELNPFSTGTSGFTTPVDRSTAVCLLPGTKALISRTIEDCFVVRVESGVEVTFVKKDEDPCHHFGHHRDALLFPDREDAILLQDLPLGLAIEVTQIPEAQDDVEVMSEHDENNAIEEQAERLEAVLAAAGTS